MSNLPAVNGKDLVRALERVGFEVIRSRGSHHFLRHADGRCTVVPVHSGESIGTGLLHKILKDCNLTGDALIELL